MDKTLKAHVKDLDAGHGVTYRFYRNNEKKTIQLQVRIIVLGKI